MSIASKRKEGAGKTTHRRHVRRGGLHALDIIDRIDHKERLAIQQAFGSRRLEHHV